MSSSAIRSCQCAAGGDQNSRHHCAASVSLPSRFTQLAPPDRERATHTGAWAMACHYEPWLSRICDSVSNLEPGLDSEDVKDHLIKRCHIGSLRWDYSARQIRWVDLTQIWLARSQASPAVARLQVQHCSGGRQSPFHRRGSPS